MVAGWCGVSFGMVGVMRLVDFVVNLAVSLLVAPTPGLVVLMYINGDAAIPLVQALTVIVVSAAAYWVWVLTRKSEPAGLVIDDAEIEAPRRRRFAEEYAPRGQREQTDRYQAESAEPENRRRESVAPFSSHDRVIDPHASRHEPAPNDVLVDRVADLRQLKSLVASHEARLISAFVRTVERDEYGASIYGDWPYEADRFLMSSAFMARTLNRQEAIATLTAEIEFLMSSANSGGQKRRRRRFGEPDEAERPIERPAPRRAAADLETATEGDAAAQARMPQHLAKTAARGLTEAYGRILAEQGWSTQATDSPGTDAIDLFAERGDLIIGLRCREFAEQVVEPVVREVVMARDRFGLDGAAIVTAHGASRGASTLAASQHIALVEPEDLPDLHVYVAARKSKVVQLFRNAQKSA